MPLPKPEYQPQFPPEQLDEAEQIARQHSAPFAQVRRAKLVLLFAAHPDGFHADLAAACGVAE